MTADPITVGWLMVHGWRPLDGRAVPNYRRCVGAELRGGQPPFGSFDDLCIDVAHDGRKPGEWFCWVVQVEPSRCIHVRMMTTTDELAKLYEGLTGRPFAPPPARTGLSAGLRLPGLTPVPATSDPPASPLPPATWPIAGR